MYLKSLFLKMEKIEEIFLVKRPMKALTVSLGMLQLFTHANTNLCSPESVWRMK